MPDNPCDVHSEKIHQLELRADKTELILEKVQNRLPNWATVVFAMLCAMIGWLIASGAK